MAALATPFRAYGKPDSLARLDCRRLRCCCARSGHVGRPGSGVAGGLALAGRSHPPPRRRRVNTREPEAVPVISAAGLTKVYARGREEVRAIDTVSFDILAGEFVAIVGPSGAGKTTLLNLIGCMDTPSAG